MDDILEDKNASVYIIDSQYRLVYFDEELRKSFPGVRKGEACFQELCQESYPCEKCPLTNDTMGQGVFYNRILQAWMELVSMRLDDVDGEIYTIIKSRKLPKGEMNLLYGLQNISAYEELFELNLTKGTYKTLYHHEDKYIIPDAKGDLSLLIKEVTESLIHPEEQECFRDFWDLSTMPERLQHKENNQILKGHFRKRMADGTYCWILETVVPLLYGINDDRIFMCFVQDIQKQMKYATDQVAEIENPHHIRDSLTGLYRRNMFFQLAGTFLHSRQPEEYCMMVIDIEHFKLFNEWYGEAAGDAFLIDIADHLKREEHAHNAIAGYMGGDDFAILLPNDKQIIIDLQAQITGSEQRYEGNAGFLPAFGMYIIEDCDLPVSTMYDRAAIALASVKGNYAQRYNWFDHKMIQTMEKNHVLLSEIRRGLANDEFIFYLQPQCNLFNGKIVGMESLVRWDHPVRGIITPGEFIPILEKNGLIASLDLHTWEKVCKKIREWLDKGWNLVPISVNVSRVDIYILDVVECFCNLAYKYQIPKNLIKIEITESAYVEEYEVLNRVVEKLRNSGFSVFMDDFGSGYSSLNMLKDVNVDVIKIDMKFLDMNEQSAGKGIGILETITSMARLMGLRMIAEGVETKDQVKYLLDIGCLFGQGYYLYRPMSVEACEILLANTDNIDCEGIRSHDTNRLQIKELLADDIFSEALMNNILGGIALYEVQKDGIRLLRVNEQYCRITGISLMEQEWFLASVLDYVCAESHELVAEIFQKAHQDQLYGAEGDVQWLKRDGSIIWLHLRVFFLREQDGSQLYYSAASDVSGLKHQAHQLEASQRALSAMTNVADTTNHIKHK